jgi:predicted DNA-binding transcriptional regulator AlpA
VNGQQPIHSTPPRLALRADEIAESIGISRRSLQRELAAGRFPRADLYVGKMPLWRVETIKAWLEGGRQS